MSNIFKIYYNFNNTNKFIYIFCKTFLEINKLSLEELTNKYSSNSNDELFSDIFDEEDLNLLSEGSVPIYIDENIYFDDTIENIKLKLLKNLDSITFEELYFYGTENRNIDINLIYNNLTVKDEITYERLINFIQNINVNSLTNDVKSKIKNFNKSDKFNYGTLINLDINNKNTEFKIQIGQGFSKKLIDNFFPSNPYDFIVNDNLYFTNPVVTSNKSLLFDFTKNYKHLQINFIFVYLKMFIIF